MKDTFIPRWEGRARRIAIAAAVAIAAFAASTPAWVPGERIGWAVALPVAALVGFGTYALMTRRLRKRDRIRATPFPVSWEQVLLREVAFFRALDEPERVRFRRELQLFLGEHRITGIGFELDDTTYVLAGASAVIPVFGFPEWEWHTISEVLVYPNRFNQDFEVDAANRTLGMVGSGAMNRIMILSKPDLVAGFRDGGDKRNVGIHEFAHLVDKADGVIDGVPGVGLDRGTLGPWMALVRRKMARSSAASRTSILTH